MGSMNRSLVTVGIGLAFAMHMKGGGVASSPQEAFMNSQIGERLLFSLQNHYRQYGASRNRCNAAALKRASRKRRNIAKRQGKRA